MLETSSLEIQEVKYLQLDMQKLNHIIKNFRELLQDL